MRILLVHGRAPVTATQLVGALADLGVSPSTFEWELSKVELGDYHLHFEQPNPDGPGGVAFSIHGGAHHHAQVHEDEYSHFVPPFESTAATGQERHGLHTEAVGDLGRLSESGLHRPGDAREPHGHHRLNLGGLRERVSDSELSPFVRELTLRLLGNVPAGLPSVRPSVGAPLSEAELALLAPAVLIAVGIEQLKVAAVQMVGEHGSSRDVAAASPHADKPFEMDSLVRALHDALPASSSLNDVKPSRRGIGLEEGLAEAPLPWVEVALLEI